MIVTVTLNPAVHVGYTAGPLLLGRENPVSGVRYRAGGAGLAVARLLQTFGHEVLAAGLAGGAAGEVIKSELAGSGVATRFTRIAMETRRIVEVTDLAGGTVTTFAEPAPYVTTEELGRLAADYRRLMAGATAVVLCGSLPAGIPPETYGTLVTYAAEAGVPVVLAASGSALRHGIARRPALVIPEQAVSDPPGGVQAASEVDPVAMVSGGVGAVAMTAGSAVRVLTRDGEWRARLDGPALPHDAVVAGLVPGLVLGWSWPDTLRHAVALAAAMQPDGEADLTVYEALVQNVRVEGDH